MDNIKSIEIIGKNKRKPIQYKIDDNGCWNCISHPKNKDGYCKIKINGKNLSVHRYLYVCRYGEIPKNLVIRHKCDNPCCINLDHLQLGTVKDNVNDRHTRGRDAHLTRTLHGKSKLTEKEVAQIRNDNRPQRLIAKQYGISHQHVSLIKRNKSWIK